MPDRLDEIQRLIDVHVATGSVSEQRLLYSLILEELRMLRRKNWKFILGIILTWWPLPLSIWWGIHENGWKPTLVITVCAVVAVALLVFGFWLMNGSEELLSPSPDCADNAKGKTSL
jgi:hypothetical protein